MLAIKLKRIGKKRQSSFRLVVSERRTKLNGRFIEDLGWANPRTDTFKINKERVLHWIGVGAQPTSTVHNLFIKASVIEGAKVPVHKKSKKVAEAVPVAPSQKADTPVAVAPATEQEAVAPVVVEPISVVAEAKTPAVESVTPAPEAVSDTTSETPAA